ncbi:Asr1405/Asl0597 family protein [Planktothrix pseudagardhii]|uniref:Uncharacterized protein n=1 Tax=Planktothrix pseudagardhii TaxID=132604 RepID=A0A9W4CHY9_9CYAN|nr:Asr1405/Asl0597 family protein [Planktothrix pseudagardhii]CAD5937107.1 hypothetical protein NO713_01671 [Planktothrix pseudagardhii]
MNSSHLDQRAICEVFGINWVDRWLVYKRLQELEIPCWCRINQPLQVQIHTPKDTIQLLSVLRQFSQSHQNLVECLEHCWHCHPI